MVLAKKRRVRVKFDRSIFFPPKNKRLAKIISTKSPSAFRTSIRKIKERGVTTSEKTALVLARTRAAAQLKRKNLSAGERRQFRAIATTKLPEVTKRRRRRRG